MSPSMTMPSPARGAHRPHQKHDSPLDSVNRHDFGVQKTRKYSSTGGGRAWTEDEVSMRNTTISSSSDTKGS